MEWCRKAAKQGHIWARDMLASAEASVATAVAEGTDDWLPEQLADHPVDLVATAIAEEAYGKASPVPTAWKTPTRLPIRTPRSDSS